MNSQISPVLAKILNECFAIPLSHSRRYVPLRQCPVCKTSDAHTQAGSTYCGACSDTWTCEGCGNPMPVDGICPCWGRM